MNAFGSDSELAHTGVRFSLSRFNTEEQIDYAIDVIKKAVIRLRGISSFMLILHRVINLVYNKKK